MAGTPDTSAVNPNEFKIVGKPGEWYFLDPYNGEYPEYGPYLTKSTGSELMEDRRGVMNTYRRNKSLRVRNEFHERKPATLNSDDES